MIDNQGFIGVKGGVFAHFLRTFLRWGGVWVCLVLGGCMVVVLGVMGGCKCRV